MVSGLRPYAVRLDGALPPGMSFDAGALRLAGTPELSGRFPLAPELSDAGDPAQRRSIAVALVVLRATPLWWWVAAGCTAIVLMGVVAAVVQKTRFRPKKAG